MGNISQGFGQIGKGLGEVTQGNVGQGLGDVGHGYLNYYTLGLATGDPLNMNMSGVSNPLNAGADPRFGNIQAPITNQMGLDSITQAQNQLAQQNAFVQALQAQNGIGNQSNVYNQLQNVANGTGPNPAQAMLANATGQNVANQAALMAGQRGSNANVGLMARQAAQQGAGKIGRAHV